MSPTADQVFSWFTERGFHLTYRSTAIRLLAHPDLPGVEVRIGTVYVVVERDGVEVYRALVREFDASSVLARLLPGTL